MARGGRVIGRYILMLLPLVGVWFLLPRLLLWLQIGTTFIGWPWQFDSAEGVNLSATVQLAQGHNIYNHNGPDAFISAPYTPLFYLLNVPVTWLVGPSFGVGRAISMLAALGVAVLLFYVIRRVTTVWSAGVLAGALWLSISPVIVWSALYTQHVLGLGLGFAGLAWIVRATGPEDDKAGGQWRAVDIHAPAMRSTIMVGALLFALAFYTKQSAFDAAVATALWLFVVSPSLGLRFSLTLAAFVVIPFAGANLILQGGLWEKVVANHPLAWSNQRAGRLINRLWGEYWPLIAWAGIYPVGMIAGLARMHRSRTVLRDALGSVWTLPALYTLIASISVLARIGNDGINYNHLLDLLLPVCLLAGLSGGWLLKWLEEHLWTPRVEPAAEERVRAGRGVTMFAGVGLAICSIFLVAQLSHFRDPKTWYDGMWPEPARAGQMRALSELTAGTPGDFLSDDSYLLLSNGHRVLYDDPFMFTTLAAQTKWDDSVLVQSLRDRRFPMLFLFDTDRWPTALSNALADDYTPKFRDVLTTYEPKQVPLSPEYDLECKLGGNGDSVVLDGYSLAPGIVWNGVARGSVLRASLYWQPGARLKRNYASFIHLVNDRGDDLAAQDNPFTGANKPPTEWAVGSVVTDTASLPISGNVLPGQYQLVAGMYHFDPVSGKIETLPATCTDNEQFGDSVLLGMVRIK